MQNLLTAFKLFISLSVLLGLLYPLFITGLGKLCCPWRANGSLLRRGTTIIGSELLAQPCSSPRYFHSRPSATAYHGAGSGGSNLAPSNPQLGLQTKARIRQARAVNKLSNAILLPADMVLSSASGLDPHISLANARLQAPRIAHTRRLPKSKVYALINSHIEHDFIGIWGEERVNVLLLNLALDRLPKQG